MSLLFTILLILMGSTFISILFKKRIEETIIFYILSTIIFVYVFGLLGHLKLGVYAFIVISIILLVASIILFIRSKEKKTIIKNIFTPGLLIFLIMNAVILYFEKGRMFSGWDEFSHWGSSIKSMFYTNDFSTSPESNLMFQSYPPAMTIFQYIFMVVKGEFIEYYAFFSYCIFCTALVLPFTSNLEWKNKTKILLYLLLTLLVPTFIFTNYYESIYIDAALGLTFGFVVSYIITRKGQYKKYDILLICMSLIVLILQKDTGLFLALIAVLIYIIDIFAFKNKVRINRKNVKQIGKNILLILLPILAILFAKLSWTYSINVNNADVMFSGSYDIKEIVQILLGNNNSYRMTVLENFVSRCFSENIFESIISLNCFQLGVAFCIVFAIVSKITKSDKRENIFFTIVMIGLVVFLFGLMITYMYKFDDAEALSLASYSRYVKIYFAGIVFIFSTVLMQKINVDTKTIVIFTLILTMFSPTQTIQGLRNSTQASINIRANFVEESNKIKNFVKEGEVLYFMDIQNPDMGYTYWIQRFNLMPIKVISELGFNVTAFEEKSDSYLDYAPIDELKKVIFEKCDYVYINGINEDFKEGYGKLFENVTPHSLYKVNENELTKIY